MDELGTVLQRDVDTDENKDYLILKVVQLKALVDRF